MSQIFRLPVGGRIDRSRILRARFNERLIEGYPGDSAAATLLANGIHLVGRSFKYHRPRGIVSHGVDEPNALVHVDRGAGRADPNNRATIVELTDGLILRSQNHWPSLKYDIGAISDRLSSLLPAGFYYKTFMWPRRLWHSVYEPWLRAAAGLGIAPKVRDTDHYLHRNAHCDVLIVGAGPAGLAAALAAGVSGRRILLADEQFEMGGSLLHERDTIIDGMPSDDWLSIALEKLRGHPNVTLLPRTTAFGYFNHNYVTLLERVTDTVLRSATHAPRERLWQVRAQQVVIATGAHERPLVFPDNDRPGVMLAQSIRAYCNRYAVLPGRRIAFVTAGPSAYGAAIDCMLAGADTVVIDLRPESECGCELNQARAMGIAVLTGHRVQGTVGRDRVRGVMVANNAFGSRSRSVRTIECDALGMAGGWTPAVHLFSQSGGRLKFDGVLDTFVPGERVQQTICAGSANGVYDLLRCLQEGSHAGARAADVACPEAFEVTQAIRAGGTSLPSASSANESGRAFIDFQNDVTARDIRLAVREGFVSVEHVKRYTTTGMATDQGKTSNLNALAVLSRALSRPIPEIGMTTFRAPYTPVTFGALVGADRGDLFEPTRQTCIHDWAEQNGARFEDVGLWKRAHYFPRDGESMHAAVDRECRAVRSSAGLLDASTLGKIEVVGPDAAEFLNRLYVNSWTRLEPGRCRYGLLLKEDGYILDDGVVARMAQDRFHVTTTTGGAARVLAHMEDYLQTEWPELDVFLTSTTEQWAVIALQGPNSREILRPLTTDIDLSAVAFPHMSVREGHICGVRTRLFRVSFTGELGYEINVPSGFGRAVWEAVHAGGRRFGVTPYGTEAMHVLRAERGFIIIGQETDGTVTPDDVGLAGLVGRGKPDFVGKRSLARPDLNAPDRQQLVGLLTDDPQVVLDEGAQILKRPRTGVDSKSLGHVTSSYWSGACGRSIALGLVSAGRSRRGEFLHVTAPSGFQRVLVTDSVFVDPTGARVHG